MNKISEIFSAYSTLITVVIILTTGVFGAIIILIPKTVDSAPGSSKAFCPPCGLPPQFPLPCPPCSSQGCQGMCMPGPGGFEQCFGKGCSGNFDDKGASISGVQQAMKMAQDLLKKLLQKKGGGGGGGGGGAPPPPQQNPYDEKPKPPATANDILKNVLKDDNKNQNNGDRDRVSDIFDKVFKDTKDQGGNTPTTTESGSTQKTTIQKQKTESDNSNKINSEIKQKDDIVKDNADKQKMQNSATTTKEIPTPRFSETENTAEFNTMSNDKKTGIGGFFGFGRKNKTSNKQLGFLGRLCKNRPWQNSIISFVFSTKFFDSLCMSRGYKVGVEQTQKDTIVKNIIANPKANLVCPRVVKPREKFELSWSCGNSVRSSGIGFDTQGKPTGSTTKTTNKRVVYKLECSNGGRSSCVVETATPEVEIIAHPPRVQLGQRTRIYWVSSGVDECDVTGPGFKETGVRGAASTNAILDTVSFNIVCRIGNTEVVSDKTTVDVGI